MVKRFLIGTLSAGLLAGGGAAGTIPMETYAADRAQDSEGMAEGDGQEPTTAPEPTTDPEPTAAPEPTIAPEPTGDPQPTTAPEPTGDPEPTEAPEPTGDPEPTAAPEPTSAPEPTATPEPTPTPETKSSNADLKELYISSSDTWGKGILKLSPALHKDKDRYKAVYDGERQSLNIWAAAEEEHAEVKVYALSGIKPSTVQKDETIKAGKDEKGHVYWKISFGDQEKEAKVRLQVTAQDGTRRDYYLTLGIQDQTAPELKKISASRISPDQASVVYKTSERGQCYYRVLEAGQKVKKPDTSKEGREVMKGSDTLTLTGLSEGGKDVVIVVKDSAGNVSSPLVIRVPDVKKKNSSASDGGNSNSGQIAQRPGYGGNKSQAEIPGSGNNGEGSLSNLKTIGGQGSASGQQEQAGTEDGKEKTLTTYSGTKEKTYSSQKDSRKKSSESTAQVKKTEAKTADAKKADELTGDKTEKNTEENTAAGAVLTVSEDKEKSAVELLESKAADAWTESKLLTKVLAFFALAGALYLILWTGARHSFKKLESSNPLLKQ